MNQQPWCVTVAIVHITFMSKCHSDTIVNCSDSLCSGVESISHTCGQTSGSVQISLATVDEDHGHSCHNYAAEIYSLCTQGIAPKTTVL